MKQQATNKSFKWEFHSRWALIVMLPIMVSAFMVWVTVQGAGVSPDSTNYIQSARSIVMGEGYSINGEAMTHFPPGYPIVLGATGKVFRLEILSATRCVAVAALGLNVCLIMILVMSVTRLSILATICALSMFCMSAPVIFIHSMAWSEAPFIVLTLAGIYLLLRFIEKPGMGILFGMAFVVGYSVITRYIGIALIPAFGISLLILGRQNTTMKAKSIILFSVCASLPFLLLLVRNAQLTDSATNRAFAVHPVTLSQLDCMIRNLWSFACPQSVSFGIQAMTTVVVIIALLAGVLYIHRNNALKSSLYPAYALVMVCFLCIVMYLLVLFVSLTYFDAQTPLDHRILFPVYVLFVLLLISEIWLLAALKKMKRIGHVFLILSVWVCSLNFSSVRTRAIEIHDFGNGFNSKTWHESETLAFIINFPIELEIYSNAGDLIRFKSHHKAYMMPQIVSPNSKLRNESFNAEMVSILNRCFSGEAFIVYLDSVKWRWYLPNRVDLEQIQYLPVYKSFSDGIIFGIEK